MDQSELEFIAKCRSDFIFFCEQPLGLEMAEHHKEVSLLPLQHRYLNLVLPTGHSKSTLFSFAYPLWRIWREKNIEFCITSSSLDQSMKMLAKCQATLEVNPFFSNLLPQNRFESWNKSQLNTANGNKLYVKPFNSTARGIHPNFIVYDDLLREGDIPMEQTKEIFWSIYFPRGQIHNCQHIVVGTPQEPTDLYSDLEKNPQWTVVRKPAVTIDEQGNWIKPLWPERFSIEQLKQIQESMSPVRFSREYLCKPVSSGQLLFPPENTLMCLDDSLDFSMESKGTITIGADFAISVQATADFNVFTVVDSVPGFYEKKVGKELVEVENPVFIRRILRFKGHGQVETLKQLVHQFPGSKVIADSSHVGGSFIPELRNNYINVDAQDFRPANRNNLLLGLAKLMEQKRLVIPNKGDQIVLINTLLRELSGFKSAKSPGGGETWKSTAPHDDLAISLALAVKDIGSPKKIMGNIFYVSSESPIPTN